MKILLYTIGEDSMAKQCSECGKKIGIFSNGGTTSKGALCNKCFKNLKKEIKDEIKKVKKNNNVQLFSDVYFNNNTKQILYARMGMAGKYSYSDIISYTPVNEGHGSIKKHTITRTVTGGLIAGGIGAAIGASTGGKQYQYVDKLGVTISFNDGNTLPILLITTETKKSSFTSNVLYRVFDKLCSLLDSIITLNQNVNSNPSSDINDLKHLKQLADEGVITQEEFEAKKKQILGI